MNWMDTMERAAHVESANEHSIVERTHKFIKKKKKFDVELNINK